MAKTKNVASLESLKAKAKTICDIVAGRLLRNSLCIYPDTSFEALGASLGCIVEIVKQVGLTFDIAFDEDVEDLAESLIHVDDLIKMVVGISFYDDNLWEEEDLSIHR